MESPIKIEQFKGTVYEKGYGIVAKLAMQDKALSVGAKGLYAYLCSYAWGKDESYPTVDSITNDLGISEQTFRRYKKELEGKGYITVNFRNMGGTNRNVYTINNSPREKVTVLKNHGVKNDNPNNKRNTLQEKKNNLQEEKNEEYKSKSKNETFETKTIEEFWREKKLKDFEYAPIENMNIAIKKFTLVKIIKAIEIIGKNEFMKERTSIDNFFNREKDFDRIKKSLNRSYGDFVEDKNDNEVKEIITDKEFEEVQEDWLS